MTTPTVTELVRNGNRVGKRVELARYTIPAGERVLHGQRINGVVRFLPGTLSSSIGVRADERGRHVSFSRIVAQREDAQTRYDRNDRTPRCCRRNAGEAS